jgi:hypothetical protein
MNQFKNVLKILLKTSLISPLILTICCIVDGYYCCVVDIIFFFSAVLQYVLYVSHKLVSSC